VLGEHATPYEPDAERFEIRRRCPQHTNDRVAVAGDGGTIRERSRRPVASALYRCAAAIRHRLDITARGESIHELDQEVSCPLCVVLRSGQRDPDRQQRLRLEPQFGCMEARGALEHQPTGGEQHDRQSHLSEDQQVSTGEASSGRSHRAGGPDLDRARQVPARYLPRRNKAEHDRGAGRRQ
jgi:hypothetical protein